MGIWKISHQPGLISSRPWEVTSTLASPSRTSPGNPVLTPSTAEGMGPCGTGSRVGAGFPGGAGGKEPTCQCRRRKRCGFNL